MAYVVHFQVYSIPIGGMLKRQAMAAGGSGSTYLYGFLDSNFREKMTKEECMDLALRGEIYLLFSYFLDRILSFKNVYFPS